MSYNFNNKQFKLVSNSSEGSSDEETIFDYKQNNDIITADYSGGKIRYGKIIAKLLPLDDKLEMLYQCITIDGELKAGKAMAKIDLNKSGKILLSLNWQWMGDSQASGTSVYVEI